MSNRYLKLLRARLLWVSKICADPGIQQISDADIESLPMLPGNGDPHFRHRKWIAEYAYFGHQKLPAAQQSELLLRLLSQVIWSKNQPDPKEEFPKIAAIDQRYVKTALDVQVDQVGNPGVSVPADWSHLDLSRRFGYIQALANGGEGIVAVVQRHHFTGQTVIKMPIPEVYERNNSPTLILRLLREARIIQAINQNQPEAQVISLRSVEGPVLNDEHISDEEANTALRLHLSELPLYAEYDYYPDGELEALFEKDKPFDNIFAATLAKQIAVTLLQIHQMPIQHRDLKPRNLLCKGDKYFLSDFGMAVSSDSALVGVGNREGTRNYMAPEQFDRTTLLTTKVDIWAFGVILYRMLTGQFPFSGSASEIERKVKLGEYEDVNTLNPQAAHELAEIVKVCFDLTPKERIKPHVIVTRLSNWLDTKGVSTNKPSFYAWHPNVITRLLQKRCVFLLFKLTVSDASVHQRIAKILENHRCSVYRIYRILGEHDCLVRAYIGHEDIEQLESEVHSRTTAIQPIEQIIACPIAKVMHHWYWTCKYFRESTETAKKINEFDVDAAATLEPRLGGQSWDFFPECKTQITNGIIRRIYENSEKKIFFVFVTQPPRHSDREQLVDHVKSLLETFLANRKNHLNPNDSISESLNSQSDEQDPTNVAFLSSEKRKDVCHLAVYELGREQFLMLIKAEVVDFFTIGELVAHLMVGLAPHGCKTMTSVVSDRSVLGREDLQLEYRAVGPVTQMLIEEFPRLIEEWRRLCKDGELDEKLLKFAGELVIGLQYSIKRPFYKAVRSLLELMLMYKLRSKPIVQLFGRILMSVSIGAQEAVQQLGQQGAFTLSTSQLLNEIAQQLVQRSPSADSPAARILTSISFDEFDEFADVAKIDSPNNRRAESDELLKRFVLFLQKVYELEQVHEIDTGDRPFTSNRTFDYLSDEIR